VAAVPTSRYRLGIEMGMFTAELVRSDAYRAMLFRNIDFLYVINLILAMNSEDRLTIVKTLGSPLTADRGEPRTDTAPRGYGVPTPSYAVLARARLAA